MYILDHIMLKRIPDSKVIDTKAIYYGNSSKEMVVVKEIIRDLWNPVIRIEHIKDKRQEIVRAEDVCIVCDINH